MISHHSKGIQLPAQQLEKDNQQSQINLSNIQSTSPQINSKKSIESNSAITQFLQNPSKFISRNQAIAIFAIIFVLILAILPSDIIPTFKSQLLPKNAWIRIPTKSIIQLPVEQYAITQYLTKIAQQSDFEAKIFNDFNAHQWYSQQKKQQITKAMRNNKFSVRNTDLNKLALLIEHGGISLQTFQFVYPHKFQWISNIFKQGFQRAKNSVDNCTAGIYPELFLFHNGPSHQKNYSHDFIAALPGSPLLIKMYDQLRKIYETGYWPASDGTVVLMEDINALGLFWPFPRLLNRLIRNQYMNETSECRQKKIDARFLTINIQKQNQQQNFNLIVNSNKQSLISIEPKIFSLKTKSLKKSLQDFIDGNIEKYNKNSLFATDIISSQEFKKFTVAKTEKRQVHLCITSLKSTNQLNQIQKSYKNLQSQSFKEWSAVYFTGEKKNIKNSSKKKIVYDRSFQGLNLLEAVTKYCPNKSIVVLLDYDEKISDNNGLMAIKKSFENRRNYAGFIQLSDQNNKVYSFEKDLNYRRNQHQPNKKKLQWLRNHLRIFNSEIYKIIPHSDLHSAEGVYYDRLAFLQNLMEMKTNRDDKRFIFRLRVIQEYIDIPHNIVAINEAKFVVNKVQQITNLRQAHLYAKRSIQNFNHMLEASQIYDFTKLLVSNQKGFEFQQTSKRKNSAQLIPRKIHQIWARGEIPPHKQIIINENKRLNPTFKHYIWSLQNVTKQNFPFTYEILQNLIKFDLVSHKSTFAMLADIMRYEIIYQHGGFYVDTNIQFLKNNSLENWITYKLVVASEMMTFDRIFRPCGFFGATPKYGPLLKLISPAYLNTRNIYYSVTSYETGPGYFASIIQSQQQFDRDIMTLASEEIFPFYPYGVSLANNYCRIFDYGKNDPKLLFQYQNKGYTKQCNNRYPFSSAIDYYDIGGTWLGKRTDRPLAPPQRIQPPQ